MRRIDVWQSTRSGPVRVSGAFSERNALEKARSLAGGKSPRLVRRGGMLGYRGHYFVYIDEAAAKLIDAANSCSPRYRAVQT